MIWLFEIWAGGDIVDNCPEIEISMQALESKTVREMMPDISIMAASDDTYGEIRSDNA